MKKTIFIILLVIQKITFAQELLNTAIVFEQDSIKIEVQRWKEYLNNTNNKYKFYEKIMLLKNKEAEEIITVGRNTPASTYMSVKYSNRHKDTLLLQSFNTFDKKNNIFYNDSTFCFVATKTNLTISRSPFIVLIQCKKEDGEWKVNKMAELPIEITSTNFCNAFFISEDIVYIDEWYKIGVSPNSEKDHTVKAHNKHYQYILILNNNSSYTKFIQEDKEYPPPPRLFYTDPSKH